MWLALIFSFVGTPAACIWLYDVYVFSYSWKGNGTDKKELEHINIIHRFCLCDKTVINVLLAIFLLILKHL